MNVRASYTHLALGGGEKSTLQAMKARQNLPKAQDFSGAGKVGKNVDLVQLLLTKASLRI